MKTLKKLFALILVASAFAALALPVQAFAEEVESGPAEETFERLSFTDPTDSVFSAGGGDIDEPPDTPAIPGANGDGENEEDENGEGETGEDEGPVYEIWNWADLAYINVLINKGRLGEYNVYRLMQNIGVTDGVDAGDGSGPDGEYGGDDDCPYTQDERRLGSYGYGNGATTLLVGADGTPLTVSAWNTGGWVPLGSSSSKAFSGNFDGRGNEISGLWINRGSGQYQGLFGYIGSADIKDVGVNTASAGLKGFYYTGGLVANVTAGISISGSHVSGEVSGINSYVGGLVGRGNGDISISDSYVESKVSGRDYAGGFVGCGDGEIIISGSHISGEVGGANYVGGLVGYGNGGVIINNSYAESNVSGTGSGYGNGVGGLVGEMRSGDVSISESYVSGEVIGTNYVGGLVGRSYGEISISDSHVSGKVSGGSYVGGLVGW
jgi:hypothetical protein